MNLSRIPTKDTKQKNKSLTKTPITSAREIKAVYP